MILIIGKIYTCTITGGKQKFVDCEQCKQQYVYQMVREAQGRASSLYFLDNEGAEGRAKINAQAELEKRLKNDFDLVPCIYCGWYQANMVAKFRGQYRLWVYWLGLAFLSLAAICGAVVYLLYAIFESLSTTGTELLIAAGIFLFAGLGTLLVRSFLALKFDPNASSLEERLAIAKMKAQTVANAEWRAEPGIVSPWSNGN